MGGEGPLSQTVPPTPCCDEGGESVQEPERRPALGLSVVWRLAANLDTLCWEQGALTTPWGPSTPLQQHEAPG